MATSNAPELTIYRALSLTAVPFVAYLFGASSLSLGSLFGAVIFGLAMLLLFLAVQILEPEGYLTASGKSRPVLVLTLGSLLFILLFYRQASLMWALTFHLCLAYTVLPIRLKRVPVLSTLTAFTIVLLAFGTGYGAAREINANAFLIGFYFALIYAAAHLINEITELNFDTASRSPSSARTFGPERVLMFSFIIASFAFVYMLLLAMAKIILWKYAVVFLLVLPVQGLLFMRMKMDEQGILVYHFLNRVLYGLALLAFVILRLTH